MTVFDGTQFECRLLSLLINSVILLCFGRTGHDISRYFLASHLLFTVFFVFLSYLAWYKVRNCSSVILWWSNQSAISLRWRAGPARSHFAPPPPSAAKTPIICYSRVEMFVRLCSVSVELWYLVGPWCIPEMTESIYWAMVEWQVARQSWRHAWPHTKWRTVRWLMPRNWVLDAHVVLGRRFN